MQGMLGRKQLEHVLQRLGLMPEGASLPQAFPEVGGWLPGVGSGGLSGAMRGGGLGVRLQARRQQGVLRWH